MLWCVLNGVVLMCVGDVLRCGCSCGCVVFCCAVLGCLSLRVGQVVLCFVWCCVVVCCGVSSCVGVAPLLFCVQCLLRVLGVLCDVMCCCVVLCIVFCFIGLCGSCVSSVSCCVVLNCASMMLRRG